MIDKGHNIIREVRDVNAEFAALEGELTYEEAQATLAEFFYHNPAFMLDLLAGIKLFPFQEFHIKGWMRNDFSMVTWGRGGSKTLAYNESSILLTYEHGMISLPTLLPNVDFSEEKWVDIPSVHLWNGRGWRLTTKIYVQPQKQCQRLLTRDGFKLEGSTNHLIKVLNTETMEIEWKRYHQIKIGDYVCISRNEASWGETPSEQEIDEAYLVGLLIGDGCYTDTKNSGGGVGITSADEEILRFVERFPHCKRQFRKGSKAVTIDLQNLFGRTLLEKWGIKRSKSYHKTIPARILENKHLLAACLSGLFDTDGHVPIKGGIRYNTTSESLSHQVQTALLTFGIVSIRRIHKTPSPFGKVYSIGVLANDNEVFLNKIGFKLSRKQVALKQSLSRKKNTNLDIVPGAKEWSQKHVKSQVRLSKALSDEWRDKIRRKKNQHHLTYDTLEKYLAFFRKAKIPDEKFWPLIEVQNEHFFYSPVVSMETFSHDCLDFNVPIGECYWSNGFISHNTWLIALFVLVWALFNPKNRIVVVSFSFRASRNILDHCFKFCQERAAQLFAANFPQNKDWGLVRGTDLWEWSLPNGATIRCLPLGDGTKIRGQRADTLIVDEFAFLPEPVVGTILQPFLASQSNITEQQTIREREDTLIAAGEMTEEERTVLEDFKKVIFLSSACFQFEHMFKRYQEWIKEIRNDGSVISMPKSTASYFVSRMGYQAMPAGLINLKIIEDAKKNTSEAVFDREYNAIFTPDSGGYFRASKMDQCTIKDGDDSVTMELRGQRDAEYVVAIDIALSGAEDSDYFAIQVLKIVTRETDKAKIPMLVHSYAVAGGNLKDHTLYFFYILKNFNVVYIAADASQGDNVEFLNSSIQSKLFKDNKIQLSDIQADFKTDDFSNVNKEVKLSYNRTEGRIIHKQPFSSVWQRAANEYMQACFDHKNVLFAAHIRGNPSVATAALNADISLLREHKDFKDMTIAEFIEQQDELVDLTKKECAMIVVKTTDLGTMQWTLPQSIKRTTGPNRVRRDLYSALLLGVWATKTYIEAMSMDVQTGPQEFNYALVG